VSGFRAFLTYALFMRRKRRARTGRVWGITPQQARTGYVFLVLAGLTSWAALWLSGGLGLPSDQAGLLMGLFSLLGLIFFPRPILRQVEFLTEGRAPNKRLSRLDQILGRFELPLRFRLRRRPSVGLRTHRH
jgi:hypothetical protein